MSKILNKKTFSLKEKMNFFIKKIHYSIISYFLNHSMFKYFIPEFINYHYYKNKKHSSEQILLFFLISSVLINEERNMDEICITKRTILFLDSYFDQIESYNLLKKIESDLDDIYFFSLTHKKIIRRILKDCLNYYFRKINQ